MAVISSTEQLQEIIASDPELARLYRLMQESPSTPVAIAPRPGFPNGLPNASPTVAFSLRLRELGHEMGHDLRYSPSRNEVYEVNFFERNLDWLAFVPGGLGVGLSLPAWLNGSLSAGAAGAGGAGAGGAGGAGGLLAGMSLADWVLLGLAVGGTAWDAFSQIQSGEAAQEIAELNAQAAEAQAADALARGAEDEQAFRQGVRGLIGSQRASFAGQNVDVAVGSAVDVQADAAYLGELDALAIRRNAQREADARRREAEILRRGGDLRAREGRYGAASTIISGATQLLANRYGFGAA